MIVQMKKVSLFVMDKDRNKSLERLRELGIIHIQKKSVSSESLTALLERKTELEMAVLVLKNFLLKKEGKEAHKAEIPEDIAAFVLGQNEKRKQNQEKLAANAREIARIVRWGDFNPLEFKTLAEKTALYPYELSLKKYVKLKGEAVIVLKKDARSVFCVSVGKPIEGETPFALPERSLNTLEHENELLSAEVRAIEEKLSVSGRLVPLIEAEKLKTEESIEFEAARAGMDTMEQAPPSLSVAWISGYCPAQELGLLKRAAGENGWALYASDPGAGDKPPTLTKNNAFVRIIKPLFDFLGTVPGYEEYDVSPSYLLFFCIFFAMIFGDAAYGSIILILCGLIGLSIKAKTGKTPDAIKLFCLLALCTIVWGAVNASWFAIPFETLPKPLRAIAVFQNYNFAAGFRMMPDFFQNLLSIAEKDMPKTQDKWSQWNVQFLCFTLAIVQLAYSHIKNIKKILPSPVALSQLGWLVMMIGLYFLVLSMLLKITLPPFAVYLIGGGLLGYFVFANQNGGNAFANVGKSFANFLPTFLNTVGSFADIISYIRLFAVGIAGTSIAQSFNSMSGISGGLPESAGALVGKLFAVVLILIFGHGLNMVMNVLSVIVHGVRLNLLEYAGNHLGMEWSGYSYKPFVLKQKGNKQ
jgi:V/A-type H+-transporting ATPase subunit I